MKCKWELWLQSKRIYTPLPWPLQRLSYKPPHLKQHHCNNSREFKIFQQMSGDYLLSSLACQHRPLICETGNKWLMCKSVYMELSDGQNEFFWDASLVPLQGVFALYLSWLIIYPCKMNLIWVHKILLYPEIIFNEQLFSFHFPYHVKHMQFVTHQSPDSLIQ